MEKNSYQDSCLGVRRVRPQVKGKMKIKKNENLVIQLKKNKKKKNTFVRLILKIRTCQAPFIRYIVNIWHCPQQKKMGDEYREVENRAENKADEK